MDKIVIEGGHRLEGEVNISGSKNAALPILISALLVDGWCEYTNVPNLRDIQSTIELIRHLGADVEHEGHTVRVNAAGLKNPEAPYDIVRKMRASILVLGPLLARLRQAHVSLPGGCAIGARPINLHLKGLECLGATIALEHGYVNAHTERLRGATIFFDVVTVGGTEHIMMAAALAEGTTVIRNAAREPEIVALADALNLMGADIQGAGTAIITINGVEQLHPANIHIIPDRIEAGTFLVAGAITQGDIRVTGMCPDHVGATIEILQRTGACVSIENDVVQIQGPEKITSVDVRTQPYPGFPTDMQAQFMALMCKGSGLSIISETVFENRFIHVSELRRMGADVTVTGHAAMVRGSNTLSGAPVMATDLRASASLILAGLVAEGITEVNRVYHLDRGYEAIESKFSDLGAAIKRTKV